MIKRETSCCFTGHRPGKLPWGYRESDVRCVALKRRIWDVMEAAYASGYRHFICGMAQGCDLYFCQLALALREKYRDVTVEAALPCRDQADRWSRDEQIRYRQLVSWCDVRTVIQEEYSAGCMQRRNRYMVDHASLLIAVCDGRGSGTRQTIEYAMNQGLMIVDIPPVMAEGAPAAEV